MYDLFLYAVFPTGMFNCYNNYTCMTCSYTVTMSSGAAVFPTGMFNCYNYIYMYNLFK